MSVSRRNHEILTLSANKPNRNYKYYRNSYIYKCVSEQSLLEPRYYRIFSNDSAKNEFQVTQEPLSAIKPKVSKNNPPTSASECLFKKKSPLNIPIRRKWESSETKESLNHVSTPNPTIINQTIHPSTADRKDMATTSTKSSRPLKSTIKTMESENKTEAINTKRKLFAMGNNKPSYKNIHEPAIKKAKSNQAETTIYQGLLPTVQEAPSDDNMDKLDISDDDSLFIESSNNLISKHVHINLHDTAARGKFYSTNKNLYLHSADKDKTTGNVDLNLTMKHNETFTKESAKPAESGITSSFAPSEIKDTQESTESSQDKSLITQVPFNSFSVSTERNNTGFLNESFSYSDKDNQILDGKTGSSHVKTSVSSDNSNVSIPSSLYPDVRKLPNKTTSTSVLTTTSQARALATNSKDPRLAVIATTVDSNESPSSENLIPGGINKKSSLLNAENLLASTKTTNSLMANSVSSKVFAQASSKANISLLASKGLNTSSKSTNLFISDDSSQTRLIKPSLTLQKPADIKKPSVKPSQKITKDRNLQGFSNFFDRVKQSSNNPEDCKNSKISVTVENNSISAVQSVSNNAQHKSVTNLSEKSNKQVITNGKPEKPTSSIESKPENITSNNLLPPSQSSASVSNSLPISSGSPDFVLVRTVKKRKQQYFPLIQRKRPFDNDKQQIVQNTPSNDSSKTCEQIDVKNEMDILETGINSDYDITDVNSNQETTKQLLKSMNEPRHISDLNFNSLTDTNDKSTVIDDHPEDQLSDSFVIGPTAEPDSADETGNETITTNDDTIMFTQDDVGNNAVVGTQRDQSLKNVSSESPSLQTTTSLVEDKTEVSKVLPKTLFQPQFVAINSNSRDKPVKACSELIDKSSSDKPRTPVSFQENRSTGKITNKIPSFTSATSQKLSSTTASKNKLFTKNLSFTTVPKDKVSAKNHSLKSVSNNNKAHSKFISFKIPLKNTEQSANGSLKEKGKSSCNLLPIQKFKVTLVSEPEAMTSKKDNSTVSTTISSSKTELPNSESTGSVTVKDKPIKCVSSGGENNDMKTRYKKPSVSGFSVIPNIRPSHLPAKPVNFLNAPATDQNHTDLAVTKIVENNSLFVENEISKESEANKNVSYLRKGLLSSSSKLNDETDDLRTNVSKANAKTDISSTEITNSNVKTKNFNANASKCDKEADTFVTKVSKHTPVVNKPFSKDDTGNSWTSPIVIDEVSIETFNGSFNKSSTETKQTMELFYSQVMWMADYYKETVSHVLTALKAASFDSTLAGGILKHITTSRKLPEKKGIWTSNDDNVLVNSKDVNSIVRLQKKHGLKECRKRLKFLKLLSDNNH